MPRQPSGISFTPQWNFLGTGDTTTVQIYNSLNTTYSLMLTKEGSDLSYIKNQTSQQSSADFNIDGNGKADTLEATSSILIGITNALVDPYPSTLKIITPTSETAPIFYRTSPGEGLGLRRGLQIGYMPSPGEHQQVGDGVGFIYSGFDSNNDPVTYASLESPALNTTAGATTGQLQGWLQYKGVEHQPYFNFRPNDDGGVFRTQLLSVDNQGAPPAGGGDGHRALGFGTVLNGEVFTIDTTGKIGMHNLHPAYDVDIVGEHNVNGFSYSTGGFYARRTISTSSSFYGIQNSAGSMRWSISGVGAQGSSNTGYDFGLFGFDNSGVQIRTNADIFVNRSTGYTGFNNLTPLYQVDIDGDINIANGNYRVAGALLAGLNTTTNVARFGTGNVAGTVNIYSGGTVKMALDASGNLNLASYGAGVLRTDASGNVTTNTALPSGTTAPNNLQTNPYSTSATPSIVAGSAAGTSPTVSIAGNNQDGIITLVVGTTPGGGTLFTVTMSGGFTYPTSCATVFTNDGGSTSTTSSMWFQSTVTSSTFTLNIGGAALTAGATYKWHYHNGGY